MKTGGLGGSILHHSRKLLPVNPAAARTDVIFPNFGKLGCKEKRL